MTAEVKAGPEITQASRFWDEFNAFNLRQLDEHGFDQFKRTVNGNYFQWLPTTPRDPQFRSLLREWVRTPRSGPFSARLDSGAYVDEARARDPFRSRARRRTYAWFVASLWEYVRTHNRLGLHLPADEPELGNPLVVNYRGHKLSQDLCNSALEMSAIIGALPHQRPPETGIMELGSGYGRLAWMFLECFPDVRYVLVDLPPALAIAERYLSLLYPHTERFEFRHFDRFEDVREEFQRAQIVFLTPNQLSLIPTPSAGLCINVSSLHEMSPDQIAHYFRTIDVHVDGYFYSKQWLRSVNSHDDVIIRREDYPVPTYWRTVFNRRHPVQTGFFEALYATRPAPA